MEETPQQDTPQQDTPQQDTPQQDTPRVDPLQDSLEMYVNELNNTENEIEETNIIRSIVMFISRMAFNWLHDNDDFTTVLYGVNFTQGKTMAVFYHNETGICVGNRYDLVVFLDSPCVITRGSTEYSGYVNKSNRFAQEIRNFNITYR